MLPAFRQAGRSAESGSCAVSTVTTFGELNLLYSCGDNPVAGRSKTILNVVNKGTVTVNLNDITIRCYCTNDGERDLVFSINYARIRASNFTGAVQCRL